MRLKIGENIFNVKVVTSKFDKAQGMMNRRFTDEFNGLLLDEKLHYTLGYYFH
jgi:hypothetical protein